MFERSGFADDQELGVGEGGRVEDTPTVDDDLHSRGVIGRQVAVRRVVRLQNGQIDFAAHRVRLEAEAHR